MADPTPEVMSILVQCPSPVPRDEVEELRVRREDTSLRFTWRDLPTPPSEYLLLRSEEAADSFQPAASAPGGVPGLLLQEPPAQLLFYEVAAWYDPGCLGPY